MRTKGDPFEGGDWGEENRTNEAGESGSEAAMSGGKLMPDARIKVAREMRREEENKGWASGAMYETPLRWRARADALAGH